MRERTTRHGATLQFIPFRRSFRRAFVTFALRAFRTALRLVFVDFARFGFFEASSIVTVCSTAAFFSKSIESWSTASIGFPAPFFLTPALTLTFFFGMKPRLAFVLTMAAKGALAKQSSTPRALHVRQETKSPAKRSKSTFSPFTYCDVHDLIARASSPLAILSVTVARWYGYRKACSSTPSDPLSALRELIHGLSPS